jgi:hypothetical protein
MANTTPGAYRQEPSNRQTGRSHEWLVLLLCLPVLAGLVVFQRTVRAKRPEVEKPYREIDSPTPPTLQRSPDWDEEDLMPDEEWLSMAGRPEGDILVARGILLRDADGRDRAELTTDGDLTLLRMLGPEGRTRVLFEAFADGSSMHLMDDDGTSRVEIVVRNGSTQLIMNEKHNGRVFRAP